MLPLWLERFMSQVFPGTDVKSANDEQTKEEKVHMSSQMKCDLRSLHSTENSCHSVLGSDTLYWCDTIPEFQRTVLLPSSG